MSTRMRVVALVQTVAILCGVALSISPLMGGCDDGAVGATGAAGAAGATAPIDSELDLGGNMPGAVLTVTGLSGGSGTNGNFQAGDKIAVTFTIKTTGGASYPLSEMDSTAIWMSGPTFNYQHVLPASGNTQTSTSTSVSFYYSDLKTAAVQNSDGSYTYTFTSAIPSTYPYPLNYTGDFTDGVLQGQALLSGTYTVAMRMYKNYTDPTGTTYKDVGNATKDFLFGSATTIEARDVVKVDNCNACHETLQMHGGAYRDTKLCVTCHTAGAEDSNSILQSTSDTTPVTIEFKVMIHKIHSGEHLPSVLGVTTDSSGNRVYGTGTKYKVGGSGKSGTTALDFSNIGFPSWPNGYLAMPRDLGFGALATTPGTDSFYNEGSNQNKAYMALKGVIDCDKCHGDRDGSSTTYTAPAQGGLHESQPTRRACGSCHDDVDFTKPYVCNSNTMQPQLDDTSCGMTNCHTTSGTTLSVRDAHTHPLKRSTLNPGLTITLSSVAESGDGDGKIEVGEKVSLTLSAKDDAGTAVNLNTLGVSPSIVISGPTSNYNVLLNTSIPKGALNTTGSSTVKAPEPINLDHNNTGASTGRSANDSAAEDFATTKTTHWDSTIGGSMTVQLSPPRGVTTLSVDPALGATSVTVTSAANLVIGDYVVIIDDNTPTLKEVHRISGIAGSVLTLDEGQAPGLLYDQTLGANVYEVSGIGASTTLSADPALGATTISLTDATGFDANEYIIIEPGYSATQEVVKITSKSGNDLTVPALTIDHANAVKVVEAPAANFGLLYAAVIATATTMQVSSTYSANFETGDYIIIDPGLAGKQEVRKISSYTETTYGVTPAYRTLTLDAALTYGHSANAVLVELPMGSTPLNGAVSVGQNYITVTSTADFSRNDYIVVEEGTAGKEEYFKIQWVDTTNNRLWFGSTYALTYPWARYSHLTALSVKEVALKTATYSSTAGKTDYNWTATSLAKVTEAYNAAFPLGTAVVTSYTTDWVVPATYPMPFNNDPLGGIGESWSEWATKALVEGTYTVGVWGTYSIYVNYSGGSTSTASEPTDVSTYRITSKPANKNFLVYNAGSTTDQEITAYSLISAGSNCDSCHTDIYFHGGGRRGFDTCVLCHGTAGAEDRPKYSSPGMTNTTDVTINFRSMLHKIHMGESLANASTYQVMGYGYSNYPNNYDAVSVEHFAFPAMPEGVKYCQKCHGTSNTAWKEPSDRTYPASTTYVTNWKLVCLECHDTTAALAHYNLNVSGGVESCKACHDPGSVYSVEVVHKVR